MEELGFISIFYKSKFWLAIKKYFTIYIVIIILFVVLKHCGKLRASKVRCVLRHLRFTARPVKYKRKKQINQLIWFADFKSFKQTYTFCIHLFLNKVCKVFIFIFNIHFLYEKFSTKNRQLFSYLLSHISYIYRITEIKIQVIPFKIWPSVWFSWIII